MPMLLGGLLQALGSAYMKLVDFPGLFTRMRRWSADISVRVFRQDGLTSMNFYR